MDIKKEVVLLTGANGQLGQEINKKLAHFYEIINLDVSYSNEQCDFYHRNVDISNLDAVREVYSDIVQEQKFTVYKGHY